MSDMPASSNSIRHIIRPREVDLGGFLVRRCLPAPGIHAVGPWVFFDHMGPVLFPSGKGVDVLPHPHINLATVTYLFDGELVHRDSIGSVQTITPGAINLMVAAGGIVHSERTGPRLRAAGHTMNGLQLWLALPEQYEENEPAFYHYPAESLPQASIQGVELRVMIGGAYGLHAPVETYSPTLYAEAHIPKGRRLRLPTGVGDRAVYLVSGNLQVQDTELPVHGMTLFTDNPDIDLFARRHTHLVILGGQPLEKRYMWWNFVSSRRERIEKAKADWKQGRIGQVPGETELYPLPMADAFSEKEK
jgi:redox-sensitive bicupin YhaK (pirin superfamily)